MRLIIGAIRLALRAPAEFRLSLRMTFWLLLVSAVARLTSLSSMLRFAEGSLRAGHPDTDPEHIARLIDRLLDAGVVRDGACWKRAAVLRRFLRQEGIDTQVAFGIRDGGTTLEGHAWLERNGHAYLERNRPEYVVTFRYPLS